MPSIFRKRRFYFGILAAVALFRCATDPGSTSQTTGSAITLFTYETGTFNVVVNSVPPKITVAIVLFDTNAATGERMQATGFDTGVSVQWPASVTFALPNGCSVTPTLLTSHDYSLYIVYEFEYPSSCTTSTTGVSASANVTVSKEGVGSTTVSGSGGSGVSYHTVFVTSGVYDGNLGGLSGADTRCATAAASGTQTSSITGTWRAILSSSTVNAKDRITFYSGLAIKNTNNQTVVSLASELWEGTLTNAIGYDQDGTYQMTESVRTGSNMDGTYHDVGDYCASTCCDWSSANAAVTGDEGDMTASNGSWLNSGFASSCRNSNSKRLYCINSKD